MLGCVRDDGFIHPGFNLCRVGINQSFQVFSSDLCSGVRWAELLSWSNQVRTPVKASVQTRHEVHLTDGVNVIRVCSEPQPVHT